ncbi:hypothetical protein CNE_1c02960 [Cupriavidus necator N-1]|uniref:Uncharacterized protein n=1 Tax=Cupriavidus necator (strain ATCC 43291 / DSM 13513 / CCUG 52238 / LMG 8453 / N-1) TaxID=1042878 RepID=G0ETZ8_CUPNN|nr:hypothetical protein CNE_1c02960 [Cupriavidus necator N-1]KAI3599686.1 hypothetical protein D8I24_5181 [Cupriavidus necator H850]
MSSAGPVVILGLLCPAAIAARHQARCALHQAAGKACALPRRAAGGTRGSVVIVR